MVAHVCNPKNQEKNYNLEASMNYKANSKPIRAI